MKLENVDSSINYKGRQAYTSYVMMAGGGRFAGSMRRKCDAPK